MMIRHTVRFIYVDAKVCFYSERKICVISHQPSVDNLIKLCYTYLKMFGANVDLLAFLNIIRRYLTGTHPQLLPHIWPSPVVPGGQPVMSNGTCKS